MLPVVRQFLAFRRTRSLAALAREIGLSTSALQRIARGTTKRPQRRTLSRMAEFVQSKRELARWPVPDRLDDWLGGHVAYAYRLNGILFVSDQPGVPSLMMEERASRPDLAFATYAIFELHNISDEPQLIVRVRLLPPQVRFYGYPEIVPTPGGTGLGPRRVDWPALKDWVMQHRKEYTGDADADFMAFMVVKQAEAKRRRLDEFTRKKEK